MHAPPPSMLRAIGATQIELDMKKTRKLHHAAGETPLQHDSPVTLIDRLEGLNSILALADDTLAATRTGLWGEFPRPAVGDLGGEGLLLMLLDVLDQRADALLTHANAIAGELGA